MARMQTVLEVADQLVARNGPERVSIPEIALAAGVPRASIYQFYSDKYALLAHVSERHLTRLIEVLLERGAARPGRTLEVAIADLIDDAADYFDAHAAAGSLMLGGPFSRNAYLARKTQIDALGAGLRLLATQTREPVMLPETPDVATLGTEIALACMRHGYYREGRVSRLAREEAKFATIAYLQAWQAKLARAETEDVDARTPAEVST